MLYPDSLPFFIALEMEKQNSGNAKFAVKMIPEVGKPVNIYEFYYDQKYHDTGKIIPRRVVVGKRWRGQDFTGWYFIEDKEGISLIAKLKPDLVG